MKITLQQIVEGMEEVIIRYHKRTDKIDHIIQYIEGKSNALIGKKDGEQYRIPPYDVIYIESVDGNNFIYTKECEYISNLSLAEAELLYEREGYFRCCKSMVINIYRIHNLRSESGNRIDATMDNGEHVMISRRYAKELRSILKGGEQ